MATDVEIAQAARAGGFPDEHLVTAVAVALAESGGNEGATNKNTNGTVDYGLWQINSIHRADLVSGSWNVPADNARMAYNVFKRAGNSWWPWYAFRGAKHIKFLDRATTAVKTVGSSNAPSTTASTVPAVSTQPVGISEVAGELKQALNVLTQKNFWIRTGISFAGAVALILGLIWLAKSTVLSAAIPQAGKVLKAVSK
jgi:hypothetical protein